jgi:hypothetical protein
MEDVGCRLLLRIMEEEVVEAHIPADRGESDVAGPVDVCAPDRAVCAGGKVAVNCRVFLGLQFVSVIRSQGRKLWPWQAQRASRGCW